MADTLDERAEKALRMVREAKELVYDTETSGIDWKRNFPIGYVVGADAGSVVYVPIRHKAGGNLGGTQAHPPETATGDWVVHPFETALAKAFSERTGLIIGHHLKFDCHMSANAGVMLGRNLTCTQNNQAILDEYARSYSLDACAAAHGVRAKKGEDLYRVLAARFGCPATRASMEFFWQTRGDDAEVVDYAIGDGITTYELYKKQLAEIQKQDEHGRSLERIFKLENELIWTLFRCERRGLRVDHEALTAMLENARAKVKEAEAKLPEGFNTRSSVHVRELMEATGNTDWPTTELGNPSFTEKWLKHSEAGRNVIAVRKWTNLINTFIVPLKDEHSFEGRVHTNFNQLKADDYGTVGGRPSTSSPNLQQVPKRDKELAKVFRKAFIADKGMLLNEADWSQCEPRLFAHYSQEPALLQGYKSQPFKDVHQVVAEMLGVERDPTAKRINMGLFTGMYPKTFATHMECSVAEATRLWSRWFEMFPGIKDFQDGAKNVFLNRGYVWTILHRKCRMENSRFAYRATSRIIQGSNADIIKYKMVELDKYFESEGDVEFLQLSIHDAFVWSSLEGKDQSEALRIMVDVEGPPFNLRVPFAVEHHAGKNWAEATFGSKA